MSQKDVKIICSAISDEIEYLLNLKLESRGFLLKPLGIGFLEAALNLENLFNETTNNITELIFIGTCGSYLETLKPGDLVSIHSCDLLNLASLQELAYAPLKNEKYSLEVLENFSSALCLSSLEISQNEKIAELVLQKNPQEKFIVENMELYGIASVCKKHNIPLKSLLGVTNYINANAHNDWLAHNQQLARKLGEAVICHHDHSSLRA